LLAITEERSGKLISPIVKGRDREAQCGNPEDVVVKEKKLKNLLVEWPDGKQPRQEK